MQSLEHVVEISNCIQLAELHNIEVQVCTYRSSIVYAACLSICLPTYIILHRTTYLPTYPFSLSVDLPVQLPICHGLSTYLPISVSLSESVCLSAYLSSCLSNCYLTICVSYNMSVHIWIATSCSLLTAYMSTYPSQTGR